MFPKTNLSQIGFAVLSLVFIFASGCYKDQTETKTPDSAPLTKGSFKLKFEKSGSKIDSETMESIKVEVTEIIKALNARVTLPVDLSIIFSTDKAAGAGPAYSPSVFTGVKAGGESGRLITYPYEFIVFSRDILARSGLSGSELVKATTATTAFVLVHETSHALIDLSELPVLGREEDAADSGAAVFLSSLDNGAEMIHHAVTFWRSLSQLRGVAANAFANEHGLDLQRAYNLMCWSYGQDMHKNEMLEHELPSARSARCVSEYQKLAQSWDKLLKASLKPKC